MKSIRVLVLLLLASVHVFTPVSSNESDDPSAKTTPTTNTTASAAPPTITTTAAAPKAASTEAPKAAPSAAPTTPRVSPTAPHNATIKAPDNSKAAVSTPAPKTASPTEASTDNKTITAAASPATVHVDIKNDTVQPRTPQLTGNNSDIQRVDIPGPDDSTEKTVKAGTTAPAPASQKTMAPTSQHQDVNKSAGPQQGDDKVPLQSDKRLWWILVPVLLVAFAAAIVLKFKCKKMHDHTETIDTGTENASFQSRPESTKDGVMLLGVKSSGGEDNAAAR